MENVFIKPNSGFGIRLEALMKQKGIDISKKGANADLARKMIKNESLSFLVNEDMRKRVETARSRIENHRKTKSAENIEGKWLKAYCDFFKCSADYLFGYIDFPTHTSTDISEETGLSEDAINFLIDQNKKNVNGKLVLSRFSITYEDGEKPYIDLLNYLLSGESGTITLLDYLYQYIFRSDFKYCIDGNGNANTHIQITNKESQSWVLYNVSQFANMLLLNITTCLSDIRKKYMEKIGKKKPSYTDR